MVVPTTRAREHVLTVVVAIVLGALATTAPRAGARTYGRLIVRNAVAPSTSLQTGFSGVRPPDSFLLVVTETTDAPLEFRWSLHCASASHRESGGAEGAAVVSSGHWVKRVRANWIKHPATCMGSISGASGVSATLVRVFAD
jgi:hypothetical protein